MQVFQEILGLHGFLAIEDATVDTLEQEISPPCKEALERILNAGSVEEAWATCREQLVQGSGDATVDSQAAVVASL